MQHPFGALTRNFRLRKLRGQQPTGPAGDDKTRVVSAKCLMSLNGHLLRPRGLLFHKIHCGAVSIEKDKYMTPAHSLKTTRSSHSAHYRRHQTYSDALKNSFFLSVANIQSTEEFRAHTPYLNKISQNFFFVCFLFYQNFKISTPWGNAQV